MEKIQILGTGCPKCNQLESNAKAAVEQTGLPVTVEKISQINEIMSFGIMITPGFAIDGKVIQAGKVLSVEEIVEILRKES